MKSCPLYLANDGISLLHPNPTDQLPFIVSYDSPHQQLFIIQTEDFIRQLKDKVEGKQNEVLMENVPSRLGLYKIVFEPFQDTIVLTKPIVEFSSNWMLLSIKQSLDYKFLAFQRSDIEVEIIDLLLKKSYVICCEMRPGNRILREGIIWSLHSKEPHRSQDLYLITSNGIEHYKVSSKRRECRFARVLASSTIHMHWYSPAYNLLVVGTIDEHSKKSQLQCYSIQPSTKPFLASISIPAVVRRVEITLVELYDQLYLAQVHATSSSLNLYQLSNTSKFTCLTLQLDLPFVEYLDIAVADNLLICYSSDYDVVQFYDIHSTHDAMKPLLSPLPLGYDERMNSREAKSQRTKWAFQHPRFILQKTTKEFNLRSLRLNLEEICRCLSRFPGLVGFLLRREDWDKSTFLIYRGIYQALIDQEQLVVFRDTFKCINQHQYASKIQRQRMSQIEFLQRIWTPSIHDSRINQELVASSLLEYLNSLYANDIVADSKIYLLLFQLLYEQKKEYQLYQLVQYQIPSDSIELAELLLTFSATSEQFLQVGIDMLLRMKHYKRIMRKLVQMGQLSKAMHFGLRHRASPELKLDVVFLSELFQAIVKQAAEEHEEPTLLFHNFHSFILLADQPQVFAPVILSPGTELVSPLAQEVQLNFPDSLFSPTKATEYRRLFGFPRKNMEN